MSLYVNTNVTSMNAQRNLNNATSLLSKSLERLSSGLRINRAGDDAAGLAISESLRANIRGLNQAVRNAQDGISLIGTAEGAVNETVNLLQRMRELSVQAASDTNSSTNRSSIQEEVTQLISEMDRIATTVQFNGSTLLNGSFSGTLQIGAFAGQTVDITIDDFRASAIGATASVTSGAMTAALSAGDLLINGTDVGGSTSDGVSTANATYSAIAIANAINSVEGETGVTATVNENSVTGGAIAGGTLNSTNNITINGVTFGADADPIVVAADDSDGALRDAINAVSNQTGVTASLDASNQLVLTAEDGRNIQVTAGGTGATITGQAAATTMGTFTLTSAESIAIGGTSPADAGLTAGTVAVDTNSAVNSVSVLTQTDAASAITTIDAALKQVNSQRGSLGALTNRLESTIANLQTTAENLSSSESRIRDTDFASETAKLTRAQILQQAGTSILAQANVTSQAALTLLQ